MSFSAAKHALLLASALALPCVAQTTAPEYFQSALKKANQGDHAGAIADYTKSIELDPAHASTYNNRANLRSGTGDIEGAFQDYTLAISLDPKYTFPWVGRAHLKADRGDVEGAIQDLSEAIQRDPKYTVAYYERAVFKSKKEDWDGAIADCEIAIKLAPKFSRPVMTRAAAYYIKRDWKEALDGFRKYAEISPSNVYTDVWIWFARMRLGETAEAYEELAGYLVGKTPPETEQWNARMVMYLLDKISHDELLAAIAKESGETAANHLCDAWFFGGMKRLQGGDRGGAVEAFKKCRFSATKKGRHSYDFARAELKALE